MLVLLWLIAQAPAAASARPPLPFFDRGACPFECCMYRDWTAMESLTVFENFDPRDQRGRAKAVFTIDKGETVTGMTGVVITTRAGRFRAAEKIVLTVYSHSFPSSKPALVTIPPGDVLYVLDHRGEGTFVGWYHGRLLEEADGSELTGKGLPESEPVSEWWARVRNLRGQIGWVRAERGFLNQDACGK